MKGGQRSQGFTIIETLMVLAVTSLMFLVAAIYISGRQNKAMYNDAINDIRSRIQQTMNEVTSGAYPSGSQFSCTGNSSGVHLSSASSTQGTNQDCVYYGKVISFGDGTAGTGQEKYRVDTLVGRRVNDLGTLTTGIRQAQAIIVNGTNDANGANPNTVDIGQDFKLKNGLSIVSMCVETASVVGGCTATPVVGVAVVTSPYEQTTYSAGGQLDSGTLQASIIGIPKSGVTGTVGVSKANLYTLVQRSIGAPISPQPQINVIYNPTGGVQLCFASGTTNQSGLVTIGSGNRGLTTTLKMKQGKTC